MDVIDTCSLVNFVKFYLPFDKDSTLLNFLESKIESKELIVIDHVYKQCEYVQKGFALKAIPFLAKHKVDTTSYVTNKQFSHWLNNDFKVVELCKNLTSEEFEHHKTKFMDDADFKMLLYCDKHKGDSQMRLLTDETRANNDSKYFKKLPTLCDTAGIECIDLPEFLRQHDLIHVKAPTV